MQDLTSEAVQDFTSIEQLFGDDQPQLANPEKEPLWSSVTSKFKGLTRKFKKKWLHTHRKKLGT